MDGDRAGDGHGQIETDCEMLKALATRTGAKIKLDFTQQQQQ